MLARASVRAAAHVSFALVLSSATASPAAAQELPRRWHIGLGPAAVIAISGPQAVPVELASNGSLAPAGGIAAELARELGPFSIALQSRWSRHGHRTAVPQLVLDGRSQLVTGALAARTPQLWGRWRGEIGVGAIYSRSATRFGLIGEQVGLSGARTAANVSELAPLLSTSIALDLIRGKGRLLTLRVGAEHAWTSGARTLLIPVGLQIGACCGRRRVTQAASVTPPVSVAPATSPAGSTPAERGTAVVVRAGGKNVPGPVAARSADVVTTMVGPPGPPGPAGPRGPAGASASYAKKTATPSKPQKLSPKSISVRAAVASAKKSTVKKSANTRTNSVGHNSSDGYAARSRTIVTRYSSSKQSAKVRTVSCVGDEVATGGGGNGDDGSFPSTTMGTELATGENAKSWTTRNKTAKPALRAWVICSR